MGNTCCSQSCVKTNDWDDVNIDVRNPDIKPKEGMVNDDDAARFFKDHIHIIVRLQAWARGNRTRKMLAIHYNAATPAN